MPKSKFRKVKETRRVENNGFRFKPNNDTNKVLNYRASNDKISSLKKFSTFMNTCVELLQVVEKYNNQYEMFDYVYEKAIQEQMVYTYKFIVARYNRIFELDKTKTSQETLSIINAEFSPKLQTSFINIIEEYLSNAEILEYSRIHNLSNNDKNQIIVKLPPKINDITSN